MRLRILLACALILTIAGCTKAAPEKDGSTATKAPQPEEAVREEAMPEKAAPEKAAEAAAEGPCDGMYKLLERCTRGRGARKVPGFKEEFLKNCRKEARRKTRYADRFVECALSKTCGQLTTCSAALEKSVPELGPDHVNYLLKSGGREDAKKFCWDNQQAVKKSEGLDRVCHALLEELAREKGEQQHTCPFH